MTSGEPTAVRVSIELTPRGRSIAGFLIAPGGVKHDFAGWLGLIASVQAAVASAPDGGATSTGGGGPQ
jgi:hypothetical protein